MSLDAFLKKMKMNPDDNYDDDDYDEDFDDYDDDDEDYAPKKKEKKSFFSKKKVVEDEFDDDDDEDTYVAPKTSNTVAKGNVVGMRSQGAHNGSEVCMIMPKSFEDANTIADVLLSHRAVVLNLEGIDMAAAQRIIDFASGACYTVGGNLQKISKKIFMIVPQDMNLSGDFDGTNASDMVDLNQVNMMK